MDVISSYSKLRQAPWLVVMAWMTSVIATLLVLTTPLSPELRIDLSTPEKTLGTYIEALRRGDKATVAECFDPPATDFYLPQPVQIARWLIIKRIVYGAAEVRHWNAKGIIPQARVGDIELVVQKTIRNKKQHFYYNLRQIGNEWKIISHSGVGWPA